MDCQLIFAHNILVNYDAQIWRDKAGSHLGYGRDKYFTLCIKREVPGTIRHATLPILNYPGIIACKCFFVAFINMPSAEKLLALFFSTVIKGVVCKKNVAHRRMTSKIKSPRLLILEGALEYHRVATHLSSFDTLLQQVC